MRIAQLLVLIIFTVVGFWARHHHNLVIEQLQLDCGTGDVNEIGPFDEAFGRSYEMKQEYIPAPPVAPSEIQANPYL